MQAPPLAALAGGAWASHRPAILAAPASLRRSRRGALRLPAWRAAGGGRAPRVPAKGAVLASDMGAEEVVGPSPLVDARSEQELVLRIRNEVEKGKLPADVAHNFENLFYNYKNAVLRNGDPNAHQIILSNMTDLFDRVLLDVENQFTFQPYHKAIREPFDYYTFGQNYIRPLVDFRNSYVGNISVFSDMEKKLQQGHNVVLMSNHQTEADPAVIALSLERSNPWISENIYQISTCYRFMLLGIGFLLTLFASHLAWEGIFLHPGSLYDNAELWILLSIILPENISLSHKHFLLTETSFVCTQKNI